MAMKMAVESMEILPGALPRPGRVPKQRLLSPETWLRCDGDGGTFLEVSGLDLGFLCRGEYIGERAEPGGHQVGHTPPRRGRGVPAPGGGVGPPGLPQVSPSGFWSLMVQNFVK